MSFYFHYIDEDVDACYIQLRLLISEMESQKVHIPHVMLREFKQGNSAKTTAQKICSVYAEGLTTDRAVRN